MGKWSKALKSGDFDQTNGMLKDPSGHCCLGVRYEVEGVTPVWDEAHGSYYYLRGEYRDGEPIRRNITPAGYDTRNWELDKRVTDDEFEKITEIMQSYDTADLDIGEFFHDANTRQDVLMSLNDSGGIGFEGIAEVIETLDWDNSEKVGV